MARPRGGPGRAILVTGLAVLLVAAVSVVSVVLVSRHGGAALPPVTILSGPCAPDATSCTTRSTSATFRFEATGEAAFALSSQEFAASPVERAVSVRGFQCGLDGGGFVACTSPQTYSGLAVGPHTFVVRGVSSSGKTGPATAFRWTILGASPPPPSPPPPSPPALPDLAITALGPGSVTVENRGAGPAGAFSVTVHGVGGFSFPGLGAGRSATASFPCHTGALSAVVDPADAVQESREGNNTRKAGPFSCRLPDLVVTALTSTSVTVHNAGGAAAGPFTVTVVGVRSFDVPGLGPGGSVTETFACHAGTLTAVADPGNGVKEASEGNNSATQHGLTCPAPDLVVASLTGTHVTVRNAGDLPAGSSVVTVTGLGSFHVPSLAAGHSFTATFGRCVQGPLTATADANADVAESDESNNHLTAGPFTCPLPDLVVSSLTSSGVTVKNKGDAKAGPSVVSVAGVGSFDVPGLAPGKSFTAGFGGCFQGPLTATADAKDQVKESDEGNNRLTRGPFDCALPDLVVSALTSSDVTVKNVGGAKAGPSVVQVSGVGSFNVPGLTPGASSTADLGGCFQGPLTATADATGAVVESDEGNNKLTAGPFTCPLPDLVVSSLTPTDVTVQNQGDAPAGPSVVSVGGVGSFQVPGLGPGASATATFSLCETGKLTATADANDAVAESDETNNVLTAGPFQCPDLVVSDLSGTHVTVQNVGGAPAGQSMVTVTGLGSFQVPALAPGHTFTINFGQCIQGNLTATADANDQVKESDEGNNTRSVNATCP